MKRWIPFILLACSGCATSWPIYKSDLTSRQIRRERAKAIPITLAVRAAPELEFRQAWSVPPEEEWVKSEMGEAVSNLVADLRKTGLFRSVVPWTLESRYDVLVESRRADGIIRCGTPFVMRPFTLYLLSGESSYRHMYAFRCLTGDGTRRVEFERDYAGSYYAPSILFLPFLSLQRRNTEVDLLRHDLAPLLPQIEALKRNEKPEQEAGPYGSPEAGSPSGQP